MGLAFFNQQRIQEKLRKASIGAETDSQTEGVLPVAEKDKENILPVIEQPIEEPIENKQTKKAEQKIEEPIEEVKVKSKPQTKKAKHQNK